MHRVCTRVSSVCVTIDDLDLHLYYTRGTLRTNFDIGTYLVENEATHAIFTAVYPRGESHTK